MNWLKEMPDRIDALGPVIVKAGDKADGYACRIIELLEEIRNASQNLYGADAYEYPQIPAVLPTAALANEVPGRQGYTRVIRNIAAINPEATDANLDLFIRTPDNGGFIKRLVILGNERFSEREEIPVPEGVSIFLVCNHPIHVNLIVQRIKL